METKNPPEISVIIPAYNESLTIGSVISDTINVLNEIGKSYEIIVVDDGSSDLTNVVAEDAGAKVIVSSRNMGKGNALRKGLAYASGDIIVTLEADGENSPYEIGSLIAPLAEGVDIVSGSRFLGYRKESTRKLDQIGNFLFNASIMSLTGKRITDSQTSFRALKKKVLDKLNLESEGAEIETELTVKSLRKSFSFKEVPITVQPRRFYASNIKTFADSFRILRTVLKAGLNQGK